MPVKSPARDKTNPLAIPGLGWGARDMLRAAVMLGLQVFILPQSRWWIAGLWLALWVSTLLFIRRQGEKIHDSFGLTAVTIGMAITLLMWPVGVALLYGMARLR